MTTQSQNISRHPVTYRATGPRTGLASFKVGVGSSPCLADHGFQDMIILPGAFLVDLAIRVHRECLQEPVGAIRHVTFLHPVVLSDGDVDLFASVRPLDDGAVEYTLYDASAPAGGTPSAPPCAKLEIECGVVAAPKPAVRPGLEEFQRQAEDLGTKDDLYRRLRANGNQYGPRFQSMNHVWRAGTEILGRLGIPTGSSDAEPHHLHPVLMDGVAHFLAAFFLEGGRTFILQSVGRIDITNPVLPLEFWVRGRLRARETDEKDRWVGDLEVFDDTGANYVRLQATRFTYLERTGPAEPAGTPKVEIAVAATFTADPIEEVLQFWGDYLGFPLQVRLAPYNQVFQELLNPDSLLHRNHEGYNVLLLNLADWVAHGDAGEWKIEAERAAALFGDQSRHLLPNGIEIAHLNRHETEYVYKEIFEDRCYLRHGIRLPEDAVVIDIGANIGLFSLFIRSQSPQATVYAYEPSPVAYRALKSNCDAYGPRLHAINAGVSDHRGTAALTFYEKSSVFSTFHADETEDRQAIRTVVANMVRGELGAAAGATDDYVDDLVKDRLDRQTFDCPLVSLSDIIRDHRLARVDLLKVDAEKCELEILRGIDDSVWPMIDQVVVEVHDRTRRALEEVREILTARGFQCAVEEEVLLQASGLFNVYAIRQKDRPAGAGGADPGAAAAAGVRTTADQFVQALEAYCQAATTPTILCLCPSSRKASLGAQELAEIETDLLRRVAPFPRLQAIGSESILARYPAKDFHDPHTDALGHIPYTPGGFAAIGTSVIRTILSLRQAPYKVIALDCDNTLWQGACGEEGPLGVFVTPAHRALQEFMIRQAAAGMLLCLCSKNAEEDVWAVFDRNPGMVLKREHLAAWRINWTAKSENLRALAAELGLGADSIIFVDDNPVECAEARAGCPEALTLELPPEAARWPQFLDHLWAWDHLRVTAEDRTRTQKVRENVERERYRGQVATLKDFIDGLQLKVAIDPPAPDRIDRISQLTFRTNQFNFTTHRRTESEILGFLQQEGSRCLTVRVSDRFGDYGLVGLLFYFQRPDEYVVDTFLLSCRVLGRGAEHQILAELGRRAVKEGQEWIEIPFERSEKNQPAWDFIISIGAGFMRRTHAGAQFRIPAARLAGLRYEPSQPAILSGAVPDDRAVTREPATRAGGAAGIPGLADKFSRIASDLNEAREISAAIETRRLHASGFAGEAGAADLPPTLEGRLLGIWRKAIGNPRLGVSDNFFDAGGTSLKAVRTVAAIRHELQLNLSIVTLFECPTVRLLADKLTPGKANSDAVRAAIERGARRKLPLRRPG